MKLFRPLVPLCMATLLAAAGCAQHSQSPRSEPALSSYYQDAFYLGNILDRAQIYAHAKPADITRTVRADKRGYFYQQTLITDPKGLAIAQHHFNALTPENVMKWEEIQPEPGVFDFDAADRFIDIAEASNAYITAHALVWHNQTPDWVFEDEAGNPISRDALLERMRHHIHTVVGRYKGRIQSWDVVNEALNEDGSLRESRWHQIIGEDYLVKAFQYAHEADPKARLYYNDYSMENPEKRAGAVRLIHFLQEHNASVHGIGTQSHFSLDNFPDLTQIEQTILDFSQLGIEVMVTELDINVLPRARDDQGRLLRNTDIYRDGLPDAVQQELAQRYRELFALYLKHSNILTRVTLWGFADADSWLNYLPKERVNHPLLFDRDMNKKPAFHAIIEAAETHRDHR